MTEQTATLTDPSTSDPRPDWSAWVLGIATAVAARADCSRAQVGAVIMTADMRIVATGYNGAPSGMAGCLTSGACPRATVGKDYGSSYDTGPGACISIHAEANAIIRASWADMEGATLSTTKKPCDGCWKLILATPLARVEWPGGGQALK
jgi:dCMP deaminase